MRRNVVIVLVVVGALGLGVLAIVRGQVWLGACFIGLGVLRAGMLLQSRRPRKPEPSIRLNLDESASGSDGSDDARADSVTRLE
jgi:hypothetical protein